MKRQPLFGNGRLMGNVTCLAIVLGMTRGTTAHSSTTNGTGGSNTSHPYPTLEESTNAFIAQIQATKQTFVAPDFSSFSAHGHAGVSAFEAICRTAIACEKTLIISNIPFGTFETNAAAHVYATTLGASLVTTRAYNRELTEQSLRPYTRMESIALCIQCEPASSTEDTVGQLSEKHTCLGMSFALSSRSAEDIMETRASLPSLLMVTMQAFGSTTDTDSVAKIAAKTPENALTIFSVSAGEVPADQSLVAEWITSSEAVLTAVQTAVTEVAA